MRSIWKGSLTFGLVTIPVKLYTATQESNLDLHMLDRKDHGKIRFVRVNEETDKEVKWDDIVKAYDYDGEFVILEEEDFARAAKEKSDTIEILEFIDAAEVDAVYYEQPYFMEPEKGGAKAYALLREAINKSGKVGITLFVMRAKEHLAIVKTWGEAIVLNRIRFSQELRDSSELNLPAKTQAKEKEVDMAVQLIEQYAGPFKPEQYKDTYADELMEVIEAKAKGKKVMRVTHKEKPAKTTDLMAQLKASLKKKAS